MFFTRLARIVAFVALVLGVGRIATAIAIVEGGLGPEALARYLPGPASPGEAIDKGALYVVAAIALGTLAEISARLQKI